jgi:hypothetical protein
MNTFKKFFVIIAGLAFIYGSGRLYFAITAGFTADNIVSDFSHDVKWGTSSLSQAESKVIAAALNQEYTYLGKGCQSYVFASEDGNYVIKFIKFQRFRPQPWLNFLAFIPYVNEFQKNKYEEKKEKLDKLFISWKIAYEKLKPETGIVFVHLNKSTEWTHSLKITDKVGFKYLLDLGNVQFLLQRRAKMLCPTIDRYMAEEKIGDAEILIDKLLKMLLSEYSRGYADNDHALMQNTGILDGQPIHIDVGQFIYNSKVKRESLFKREIYDKTYNFYKWLQKHHPALSLHLKAKLVALLGVEYFTMSPYIHKGGVNKISNQLN